MKALMKRLTVLLFLLAVSVAGGAYASQAAADDSGASPVVTHGHGMFASLGLTDDQKAQVKGIFQKYRPLTQPLMQQLRAERKQLRVLMHTAPVDDAAIRAEVAKVAGFEADLAVQRAHLIQEILAVLTPDQLQKLTADGGDAAAKIDRFILRVTRHRAKG